MKPAKRGSLDKPSQRPRRVAPVVFLCPAGVSPLRGVQRHRGARPVAPHRCGAGRDVVLLKPLVLLAPWHAKRGEAMEASAGVSRTWAFPRKSSDLSLLWGVFKLALIWGSCLITRLFLLLFAFQLIRPNHGRQLRLLTFGGFRGECEHGTWTTLPVICGFMKCPHASFQVNRFGCVSPADH